MGKLYSLKKWLTLPEAAQYLTTIFDESVAEADVLRLALDGHLTLSVNFINHARARCGKVVPIENAKYQEFSPELIEHLPIPAERKGRPVVIFSGLTLNEKEVLELENQVVTLNGVYDLPMIGSEALDVEQMCQKLTGGPDVNLFCLEGALVKCPDGKMCVLQESFDNNEFQSGSRAQLQEIEGAIDGGTLDSVEAEALLKVFSEKRKKFLQKPRDLRDPNNYYPAGGLPIDSVLVVRIDALRELQEKLIAQDGSMNKVLGARAEVTYQNIIGGLVELMLGKTPAGKAHSVFKSEAAIISTLLANHPKVPGFSKRTLEDKFAVSKRSLAAN